jgi:hypothetical protein
VAVRAQRLEPTQPERTDVAVMGHNVIGNAGRNWAATLGQT